MSLFSWLQDMFFFVPGFPGHFNNYQIYCIGMYILILINSFAMFTLSLRHQYAQFALSIQSWMILTIFGLTISNTGFVMYTILFKNNKRTFKDNTIMLLAVDAIRLISFFTTIALYQGLCTIILFVYIYTSNNLEYRAQLDQGFKTYGYLDFTQRKLDYFLLFCQFNFMFHILFLSFDYLIYALKPKIKSWLQLLPQKQQQQQIQII